MIPLLVSLLLADPAPSDDVKSIEEYSLEELLDFETEVASAKALSLRESPGIVTVITREEIMRGGARDLVDVLHLVPGFAFGVDVEGVVGVGFRSAWGHEGKVLLMVDGQPMNELLYGTLQFGNHIPLEQVDRIEIIRGPGSATYGGFAELAVINVVTRTGAQLEGIAAAGTYGQMSETYARRTATLSAGFAHEDTQLSAQMTFGQGTRSHRTYEDLVGGSFDMADQSRLDPLFLNFGATAWGVEARVIYDDFRTTQRDHYDEILDEALRTDFRSIHVELKRPFEIAGLILTPRFAYRMQEPWHIGRWPPLAAENTYDKTVRRLVGALTGSYDVLESLNVLVGLEASFDKAEVHGSLSESNALFTGDEREVSYQNLAAFAEGLWQSEWVNAIAGLRFETHSQFGASFVPRVGLTKAFESFHVKLLGSRAFKAPSIENINLNPDIEPEYTTVVELEGGAQIGKMVFVSANVFDITMQDPILYFYDEATDADAYVNGDDTGSRGVEAEVRVKTELGYAALAYGFATTAGKGSIDLYAIDGRDEVRALPAHKLSLVASWSITPNIALTPSVIFMSKRYGDVGTDDAGEIIVGVEDAALLVDATLYVHDLLLDGLEASLSIHNATGHELRYLQPYDGGHAPLPGLDREVTLRLAYHLGGE